MLSAIIAIIGGIVAASSLVVAKKPNAKELLNKLTTYQGWIGIVLVIWGAKDLIGVISNMGVVTEFFITWVIGLTMSLVKLIVGFLLGFSLISKYLLEKSKEAKRKGSVLRTQLTTFQIPTGLMLTVLGILYIVLLQH